VPACIVHGQVQQGRWARKRDPENVGKVEDAVIRLLRKETSRDLVWESKSSRLTSRRVTGERDWRRRSQPLAPAPTPVLVPEAEAGAVVDFDQGPGTYAWGA